MESIVATLASLYALLLTTVIYYSRKKAKSSTTCKFSQTVLNSAGFISEVLARWRTRYGATTDRAFACG